MMRWAMGRSSARLLLAATSTRASSLAVKVWVMRSCTPLRPAGGADLTRTQAPLSWSRRTSYSSVVVGMRTILPRAGPSVPRVQARVVNCSSRRVLRSVVVSPSSRLRSTALRSLRVLGPRSKRVAMVPQGATLTLARPQARSWSAAHWLACSPLVEPVRRGPMVWARCVWCWITRESVRARSMTRAMVAGSPMGMAGTGESLPSITATGSCGVAGGAGGGWLASAGCRARASASSCAQA